MLTSKVWRDQAVLHVMACAYYVTRQWLTTGSDDDEWEVTCASLHYIRRQCTRSKGGKPKKGGKYTKIQFYLCCCIFCPCYLDYCVVIIQKQTPFASTFLSSCPYSSNYIIMIARFSLKCTVTLMNWADRTLMPTALKDFKQRRMCKLYLSGIPILLWVCHMISSWKVTHH